MDDSDIQGQREQLLQEELEDWGVLRQTFKDKIVKNSGGGADFLLSCVQAYDLIVKGERQTIKDIYLVQMGNILS